MGMFGKKIKPGNIYNLTDSVRILKGVENFTTIEVGPNQYRIIPIEESRKIEEGIRQKKAFRKRIDGDGIYHQESYQNIKIEERKFNNWQANKTKGYNNVYTR